MALNSPEQVAAGFAAAWNRRDADELAALFTMDADFVNVVGMWWDNRPRIRQAHARGFAVMFGASNMQLVRTKLRELGPDAAVVHAQWTMSGQVSPEGEPVGDRAGIFSFVMARQPEGDWLAVSAHNTDLVENVETMVAGNGSLTPTTYRHVKG